MSDGRKYFCFCEANCKFETMTKEQILAAIAQAAETGLVFDADAAFITQVKESNAGNSLTFWLGTQAQYNALVAQGKKDPHCFYILTDCDAPAELTQKVKALQQAIAEIPAAIYAAAKKAAPHNLLDNSDFRNPINQRGENTYTDTNALTIDRWRKRGTAAQCEVVVESGGVRIKRIASEGYTGIMQVLEFDEARFGGKTLTFAVKLKECGTRTCIRLISSDNGTNNKSCIGEAFIDTVGIHTVTATIPLDFEYPYFGVAIIPGTINETSSLGAAGEVVIEWCALYGGEYTAENLPEYQPKGYAAELMECRRYFYKLNLAVKNGLLTSSCSQLRFGIPLPVIMRLTNPTVTELNISGLRTATGSNMTPTITEFTAQIYADGWLDLLAKTEAISGATNNTPVAAYVGAVISADL